jgi:phosphoglycerate dehydrogenase-like enzyme
MTFYLAYMVQVMLAPHPWQVRSVAMAACRAGAWARVLRKGNAQKESVVQIGMIGLGRRGAHMVRRLLATGHE